MRHIYVHVPFCARRCVYCDFAIAVRKKIPARRYVDAVLKEHEFRLRTGEWRAEPAETLYFGGGTPSLLHPDWLARLVRSLIGNESSRQPNLEVTLEANPDDVSDEVARRWVRAGVNRVSLGAQSFDSRVLNWMHRTHRAEQSVRAVRQLRDAGIKSISLDLIFALPTELPDAFASDLMQAIDLEPDHLSVYGMTVEPCTALARWVSRGAATPASDGRYADQFLMAHDTLTHAGYEHYEVSNYAKSGHRAQHNRAYWNGHRYAGLGPSAHAYADGHRRWNVDQWAEYERRVTESGDPTSACETLTQEQLALERVYLCLRTSDGLPVEQAEALNHAVRVEAVQSGWMVGDGTRWCLTPTGWLRLDELIVVLTTSANGG